MTTLVIINTNNDIINYIVQKLYSVCGFSTNIHYRSKVSAYLILLLTNSIFYKI